MNVLQKELTLGKGRSGLKILVVEDDELSQRMMKIILAQEGHEVHIASGGNDAVRVAEEHEFDIILMDLQMPDMDGLETSRQIRKSEGKNKNPYIVALTASYLPEKGRELFESGIDNYLAKPFNVKHLHGIINYGIGRRTQETTSGPSDSGTEAGLAAQPVLDHEAGTKLVGGDERDYRLLLADFADKLRERIKHIEMDFEAGDLGRISRAAHTLKGVSLHLGALQLYEYAGKLEHCADEGYTASDTLAENIQKLGLAAERFLLKASEFLST